MRSKLLNLSNQLQVISTLPREPDLKKQIKDLEIEANRAIKFDVTLDDTDQSSKGFTVRKKKKRVALS